MRRRLIVVLGALAASMALAPTAVGSLPGQGELQRTVGGVVSEASAPLSKAPAEATPKPSTPAPSPAPRAADPPSPAPSGSAPRPAGRAAGTSPSASKAAGSPGSVASQAPKSSTPTRARASGGSQAADPTDETSAAPRPVAAESASTGDADASTLPFTGSTIFPVLLVATLALVAGTALRLAVRTRA